MSNQEEKSAIFETIFETALKYDDKHREKVLIYSKKTNAAQKNVSFPSIQGVTFDLGLDSSSNTNVEDLMVRFKSFDSLSNLIPKSTKEKIIEKFKDGFEEFEKSFAATQLVEYEKKYSDAIQEENRIKANLLMRTDKKIIHKMHTDVSVICTTGIFYLNTNKHTSKVEIPLFFYYSQRVLPN